MKRRGLTPQQLFDGAIAEQRAIKTLLEGATRVRPIDTTGNWSYRLKRYYGERTLITGDAAAFIDPVFSTGALMALTSGKYAAETIDEAITANDFGMERFAQYQEKAIAGADLFKRLVYEFYSENLRSLLTAHEQSDTVRAVITSMLAGDVYRPRIWHQMLRQGFSNIVSDEANAAAGRRAGRIKPYEPVGSA
jgi:flavin-dependent dehydrogenase